MATDVARFIMARLTWGSPRWRGSGSSASREGREAGRHFGLHVARPPLVRVENLHGAHVDVGVPRDGGGIEEAAQVLQTGVEHLGEVRVVLP